jgi:hypothetical protein
MGLRKLRYLLAEGRHIQAYFILPIAFGLWFAYTVCQPNSAMLQDWTHLLLFLFVLVLTPVVLLLVAMIYAWFVLWPINYLASRWNGAPFHPGDRVRILSRPHRDRLVEVLEVIKDRNEVRVLLDEQKGTKEVLLFIEVCRVRPI